MVKRVEIRLGKFIRQEADGAKKYKPGDELLMTEGEVKKHGVNRLRILQDLPNETEVEEDISDDPDAEDLGTRDFDEVDEEVLKVRHDRIHALLADANAYNTVKQFRDDVVASDVLEVVPNSKKDIIEALKAALPE